jgi:hypothetical protein
MYHDCHEEEELYRKHRHFQKELLHLEEEDAKLLLLRPLVSLVLFTLLKPYTCLLSCTILKQMIAQPLNFLWQAG